MPELNVALVTGTSSGIGLHTAVGLASKGFRVVATMRDTSRASALLAEAADQGVEVTVRELDVTDRDGARRVSMRSRPISADRDPGQQCRAGHRRNAGATRRCCPTGTARRQLPGARRPRPAHPAVDAAGRLWPDHQRRGAVGEPFLLPEALLGAEDEHERHDRQPQPRDRQPDDHQVQDHVPSRLARSRHLRSCGFDEASERTVIGAPSSA